MIKVTELRVGNYVKYTDSRTYVVDAIDAPMKRTNLKGLKFWNTINDISGIPLTEEILLKAGFEKKAFGWCLGNGVSDFKVDKTKNGYKLYASYCPIPSILYLHQLQNLYFALTGTEININL